MPTLLEAAALLLLAARPLIAIVLRFTPLAILAWQIAHAPQLA